MIYKWDKDTAGPGPRGQSNYKYWGAQDVKLACRDIFAKAWPSCLITKSSMTAFPPQIMFKTNKFTFHFYINNSLYSPTVSWHQVKSFTIDTDAKLIIINERIAYRYDK